LLSAATWRKGSLIDWSDSRLVATPGMRCRATSRLPGRKLWIKSCERGMRLASTASITLFA
jgi:hypothetical protein